jgi:hypothetical protein
MAMVEHRHELERKTKPILDTLRSYQDLPPVRLLDTKAISFLTLCCVARGMVLSQLFQGSPCFNWDASPFRAMFPWSENPSGIHIHQFICNLWFCCRIAYFEFASRIGQSVQYQGVFYLDM